MVKGKEEEQQGYKRFDNPFWDDNMMEADLEEEDENPGEEDPDCPSIKITAEERERIRKPWKDAIIIKVLDKQLGYMYLRRKLQQKWGPKGQFLMADIDNDFYVVKFTNMDDLKFVLSQGPWLIGDNYLTIQRWRPNFIAEEEKLRFIAAWIRIPNLSMEYFDSGVLTMIGKHVGRVLKIDKTTAMGERGRFTRLCVEVDTEKPLLSKFRMIGRIWRIQYEGFKMICFNCGKIGHESDACGKSTPNAVEEDPVEASIKWNASHPEYMTKYGQWMIPEPTPRKLPANWGEKAAQAKKKDEDGDGGTPPAVDPGDGFKEQGGKKNSKQGPTQRVNSGPKNKEITENRKENGSRFSCLAILEAGDSSKSADMEVMAEKKEEGRILANQPSNQVISKENQNLINLEKVMNKKARKQGAQENDGKKGKEPVITTGKYQEKKKESLKDITNQGKDIGGLSKESQKISPKESVRHIIEKSHTGGQGRTVVQEGGSVGEPIVVDDPPDHQSDDLEMVDRGPKHHEGVDGPADTNMADASQETTRYDNENWNHDDDSIMVQEDAQ
ncbi:hypothetical protein V2J09_015583 [Rumex salicifolius]